MTTNVKVASLVVASLVVAWLHLSIAEDQFSPLGFAAGPRETNYLAYYLGNGFGALGFFNAGFVFKFLRPAAIILCVLLALLPIMYFLTW